MPGRLVDAAALRVDDAVLDLVAHAEAVAAADRVRLEEELEERRRSACRSIATGTPCAKSIVDLLGVDLHVGLPERRRP